MTMERAGTFDLMDLGFDLSLDEEDSFSTTVQTPSEWTLQSSNSVPSSPIQANLKSMCEISPLWGDAPGLFGDACGPLFEAAMVDSDYTVGEITALEPDNRSQPVSTEHLGAAVQMLDSASAPVKESPSPYLSPHTSHHDAFAATLTLRLTSSMETLWYADRPFPSFTVDLCRKGTVEPLHVGGCVVTVTIQDAYGCDASDRLSPQVRQHQYPLNDGTALINAIRFCGVSSKAGGAFKIIVAAKAANGAYIVEPFVSKPIQILSYRLYHAPKVSQDDLRPNDSVSKMKGIGMQYAKRLSALGIQRIVDLASIDPDSLGSNGCEELLQCLRRQRGALTHSRLLNYIEQAVAVCDRFPSADTSRVHRVARSRPQTQRPLKRRRLSIQETTCLFGASVGTVGVVS